MKPFLILPSVYLLIKLLKKKAHHKSIELDKSLGLHDSFDNFDSLSDDQSLNPTKSGSFPTDEVVSVRGKELQLKKSGLGSTIGGKDKEV